jgi:hypothetical protein
MVPHALLVVKHGSTRFHHRQSRQAVVSIGQRAKSGDASIPNVLHLLLPFGVDLIIRDCM